MQKLMGVDVPKKPFLVQRISYEENGIDKRFFLDYMGSAEFEFGAIPKAFKKMRAIENCKIKRMKKNLPEGMILWYVGTEQEFEDACAFIEDQVEGKKQFRTKEPTYLDKLGSPDGETCDGWWALDLDRPWAVFRKKNMAKDWLFTL